MALIGEDEGVVGQIFEQGRRRLARLAAGQIARIVLDGGAGAGGLDHLHVEGDALVEPLGFQQTTGIGQFLEPPFQLFLDFLHRLIQRRARRDVVGIGVDFRALQLVRLLARQRVELGDRLDLVSEQADAPGSVVEVGRKDFDRVAAHAKRAALKIHVAALVLLGHEVGEKLALVERVADLHLERHGGVGFHRPDTVDAGHGGDDDDVVALQQRAGGGVAHPVDLLVDRGFLLDERVGARHVGFRLVIVVVGNEIFDRVVGEERFHLPVKLRGQRLVRRQNEGRAVGFLDDLGHREGLARAGDAKQNLRALAAFVGPALALQPADKFADGGRLVALRLVFADDLERNAAFGFVGTGGPVGHPDVALHFVAAVFDEVRQRLHRGGDAGCGRHDHGFLGGYVETGDGVETGSDPLFHVVGTADDGASAGAFFTNGLALLQLLPRRWFRFALDRFRFGFPRHIIPQTLRSGIRLIGNFLCPRGHITGQRFARRLAFEGRLRGFGKAVGCRFFGHAFHMGQKGNGRKGCARRIHCAIVAFAIR